MLILESYKLRWKSSTNKISLVVSRCYEKDFLYLHTEDHEGLFKSSDVKLVYAIFKTER